jgi:hypothetical protein
MIIKDVYIIGENKPPKIRRYLSLTMIDRFTAMEGLTMPGYSSGARTFETLERATDYNRRLCPYSEMKVYKYNPCSCTVMEV